MFFTNNKLKNIDIKLKIDKYNINKEKILGIISHELTHIKEYYEVQKKNNKLEIKIHPVHISVKDINEKYIKTLTTFDTLYKLIYLSLDDEMNARISQIYHYLYSFDDHTIVFESLHSKAI